MSDQPGPAPTDQTAPKRWAWPKFKGDPVSYWLAAGLTEFVNGFIGGMGGGALAGAGTGVAASSTGLWQGGEWLTQILVAAFGMTVAALGNAFKQFVVWHHANPMPNPWPAPAGGTNPGIPTK